MNSEQLNLLLTSVIAFAGLMQGTFAVCLFYNAIQQRNINRYIGILDQYKDLGEQYMFYIKEEFQGKPIILDDQIKGEMVTRMQQMDKVITAMQKKALGRKFKNMLNIPK